MRSARCLALLVLISAQPAAFANKKQPPAPPPDLVARVRAAHSIYLSNATEARPGMYYAAPYKEMYQALSAWSGIQLVDAPGQADLIFQVAGSEVDDFVQTNHPTMAYQQKGETTRIVSSSLKIIDPTTQVVLWQTSTRVGASNFESSIDHDFAKGATALLAPFEPESPAPKPSKSVVALPSELRTGTKIFLRVSSQPAETSVGAALNDIIGDAVRKSGLYQLVDSADAADLIFAVNVAMHDLKSASDDSGLRLSALDPKTEVVVWEQTNDLDAGCATVQSCATQTMPYALADWKSLLKKKHL